MKKFIIYLFATFIAISPLFVLTGCSEKNIDKLAYVISIGMEPGEKDKLKIFFEISTPTSSGSDSASSSQGSEKSSSSTVVSVECSSIDSGLNLLNSYLSKPVDLSHCSIIVFSSDLAKKGLHEYIYTFVNNVEIRPSCNVLVCTCSIKDFFDNSSNSLESYSSNYDSLNENLTGYTEIVTISDFFLKTNDTFGEPFAILCGLSSNDISSLDTSTSSGSGGDTEKKEGKPTLKTLGLAVFKQDKLVGFLSPHETLAHLILTNKLENTTIGIPSPFDENSSIDIFLTQKRRTKIKINIIDGKPVIDVDAFLTAKISSISNNNKYLDEKNIELLQKATNDYLEKIFMDYFSTTATKYKSDVAGLGQYAVDKFWTWNDWNDFNWKESYTQSSFNINVDTNITSSYFLLET